MRKSFALAAILMSTIAGSAFALGEARFKGKVLDTNKKPIAGATINVAAVEGKNVKLTYKTDKKGEVAFILLDGTLRYKLTVSKEGFAPYEETAKFKLMPENNERTVTLASGTAVAAAAATQAQQAAAKADPAVTAFNDGAALANAGNIDGAIAKFEEAVAAKPTLTAGHIALTKVYSQKKNWAKVIENGNKVLAIDTENPEIAALLAKAYQSTGDKVKAAEFRKKAPADPTSLFNEAAKSINSGKDKDAEPLLTQAIAADATFAPAHYELGMLYARSGKNADARRHLQRYIELEPKGKDTATAKEMLNYVK